MYDVVHHKWISPIRDTVRTQSGHKLTQWQIREIIRSLPSSDHAAAREARSINRARARAIRNKLDQLHLGYSYHYRAVVLGHADRFNEDETNEAKYYYYYTDKSPPVREHRHNSSEEQKLREMLVAPP